MTSEMSETLAAAWADASEGAARAEAAAREAKEARVRVREAAEAAARSAVETVEIEMAARLSEYIGGGMDKRRRIVRESGLLSIVQRYLPSPEERYNQILATVRRNDPPADPDNRPTMTDRAETVAPQDDGPPLPG